MIRCRLAALMAEAPTGPMKQKDVAERTGIRPATVSDIYHSKVKRLDVGALDRLCDLFKCQPGDLLVHVPPGVPRRGGG